MARLDTRLLPLLEALAASGADWLAFELVGGIQMGVVREESSDALNRARAITRGLIPQIPAPGGSAETPPVDLVGDEQIDWAIAYVNTRLDDVLVMLQASLEGLDEILQRGRRGQPGLRTDVALVMQDDEALLEVDRPRIPEALQDMGVLRSTLRNWRLSLPGEL